MSNTNTETSVPHGTANDVRQGSPAPSFTASLASLVAKNGPMTAKQFANELKITKTEVNKFLYKNFTPVNPGEPVPLWNVVVPKTEPAPVEIPVVEMPAPVEIPVAPAPAWTFEYDKGGKNRPRCYTAFRVCDDGCLRKVGHGTYHEEEVIAGRQGWYWYIGNKLVYKGDAFHREGKGGRGKGANLIPEDRLVDDIRPSWEAFKAKLM